MSIRTSPWSLTLLMVLLCLVLPSPSWAEPSRMVKLPIQRQVNVKVAKKQSMYRPLRVMTFNIAHGSNNPMGIVPLFAKASTIRKRLRRIATYFKTVKADVIGLQEADGPSWWSGWFNHVTYLSKQGMYPYSGLGIHVQTRTKQYGTALLSRLPLQKSISYRFKPLSMFKKGFVLAQVKWPGRSNVVVDVVSLHLDPQNKSIQSKQLKELVAVLKKRNNRVIVLGDFNTTWGAKSPLQVMVKSLKLKTFQPKNKKLYTHRFPKKKRIDWIFISPNLRFVTHSVPHKNFTDHYPVIADIALAKKSPKTRPTSAPTSRPQSRKLTSYPFLYFRF